VSVVFVRGGEYDDDCAAGGGGGGDNADNIINVTI